jgi:hypothetical protein
MPGFWAHAAIYVGRADELKKLGLQNDPRVARHWKKFCAQTPDGHTHVILEAVPAGVRFTTLEHCIGVADSAAALRPNLDQSTVRECIAHAFDHLGKEYDFEFDFFSADKLVCTELVHRAYSSGLNFALVDVLGRKTLPPTEIVKKFASERLQSTPQLSCIAFLDGNESTGTAQFADAELLAATADRPGLMLLPESAATSQNRLDDSDILCF